MNVQIADPTSNELYGANYLVRWVFQSPTTAMPIPCLSTGNHEQLPSAITRHEKPTLRVERKPDRSEAVSRALGVVLVLYDVVDGLGILYLSYGLPVAEFDSAQTVSIGRAAVPVGGWVVLALR